MDDDDDDEDDEDDRGVRRADAVLRLLFDRLRAGTSGRRLERVARAEADLRRCIEAEASRLFTTLELELLVLERHFDPVGAALRVAAADVVLLALPIFLDDPRWHGADVEDRRVRIRLAARLASWLVRLPELRGAGSSCAMWDVEAAVDRARSRLREERRSAA